MSEEEDSQEKKEKNNNSSNGITVTNFRGSPKVLQISKGNYYYLINRENYDLTKIMMLIDYNRLSTLGQKFREYDGGIEKIIFCTLLTNILKTDKMPINELTDLIYGIYKFFAEIDFNGDNNMEWAEFTQFIIDKVEGEHNIAEEEQDKKGNILSEKEILKYKRYELSQNIHDYNIHRTDINTAAYMNNSNKVLISEYNSHIIKVYNPLNGKIENLLDIQKINYDIEKDKINDILRDQKEPKNIKKPSKKILEVKSDKKDTLAKILGKNYLKKKLQDQHD